MLKSFLYLSQRPTLRLVHKYRAHYGSQNRAGTEQKVCPKATLGQQDRCRQSDQEVEEPIARVRQGGRRRTRSLRLDLSAVDLDGDCPGQAVDDGEYVDADDDDPATSTE